MVVVIVGAEDGANDEEEVCDLLSPPRGTADAAEARDNILPLLRRVADDGALDSTVVRGLPACLLTAAVHWL